MSFEQGTYTVAEGSTVPVTVTLNADPERTVTIPIITTDQDGASSADYSGVPADVTFNAGDTEVDITFSASSDSVDDDGESVKLTFGNTLPAGVSAGNTDEAVVSITDDDTAGVSIDPTALTVVEQGSNSYTVVLDTQPTGDVTVTISGAGTRLSLSGMTLAGDQLTFTTDNWNTAQTVTLTAGDVFVDTDVTLSHAVSGGDYDSVSADDVAATILAMSENRRIIQVGVTATQQNLAVPEGGSETYLMVLGQLPTADVSVGITVEDTANNDVTTDETSLTFTTATWNQTQTVTVRAAHDEDAVQDPAVSISHTASGAMNAPTSIPGVTATITEDDAAGVAINPTSLTILEGNNDTYTVVLDTEPAGNVTITISGHTGTDVSLDKTTLTFTDQNWGTAQTVTITALEDGDSQDESNVTLAHTVSSTADTDYEGISAGSVTVSITDDDAAGVTISETFLTIEEGSTDTYTVVLNTQPAGNVTVTLTGADGTDLSVDKTTLTFTRTTWETAQTVTVTAVDDQIDDDGETVTLTHTVTSADDSDYQGISAASVAVSITDDDVPSVSVSFEQGTYTVAEGSTVPVTVTLNADPERTVTIPITTTDQDGASSADYSGVPADVTFNAGDTEVDINFSASSDSVDDDGESVKLTFGNTLPAGVSAGNTDEAVVSITDDDVPSVRVSFEQGTYTVDGGQTPCRCHSHAERRSRTHGHHTDHHHRPGRGVERRLLRSARRRHLQRRRHRGGHQLQRLLGHASTTMGRA